MDEKTKSFLSLLERIYESSQEVTKGVIDLHGMEDKDPLNMKISARKEVIGDVLETLKFVGMISDSESLEWAESFGVEIDVEIREGNEGEINYKSKVDTWL